MGRRLHNLIPFSRDYRRPPKWGPGLPPRRPPPRLPLSDPRRWLKQVIVTAGMGLVLLPGIADAVNATLVPASRSGCRVAKVIDGDTVVLWCAGRGLQKARLKGFDAPEVFSPSCPSEWTRGIAATWHLRRLFFGAETITVAFAGEDRYGRALVSIATDAGPIAGRMIADGYGRAYDGGERKGWCA
jgi:endonuclease YncB( thermonuclease family)